MGAAEKATLDPVAACRLLAHNHAALRHRAHTPEAFHVRSIGELGMVDRSGGTRYEFGTVYGGTADTDTMALAITLGVRLLGVGVQMGQMRAEFASDPGALTLADVRALLKSEELRREDNLTMCALMVCMLDNRKTILDNMHHFGSRCGSPRMAGRLRRSTRRPPPRASRRNSWKGIFLKETPTWQREKSE